MKTAYLIVDVSNDFVDDRGSLTAGAPAQAIVPAIVSRAEQTLKEDGIVLLCMDAHHAEDEHFMLWPRHNIVGSWGAQPYGELAQFMERHSDNPAVMRVDKPEYDAFIDTELFEVLVDEGVDRVRIAGVCTDICVFLTAYGAYRAGYPAVVSKSEVATFTQNGECFLGQMKAIFKTDIED